MKAYQSIHIVLEPFILLLAKEETKSVIKRTEKSIFEQMLKELEETSRDDNNYQNFFKAINYSSIISQLFKLASSR